MNNSKALKFGGVALLAYLLFGKSKEVFSFSKFEDSIGSDSGINGHERDRFRDKHTIIVYGMPLSALQIITEKFQQLLDLYGRTNFLDLEVAFLSKADAATFLNGVGNSRRKEIIKQIIRSGGEGMYYANWEELLGGGYGINPFKDGNFWDERISIEATDDQYLSFIDYSFCDSKLGGRTYRWEGDKIVMKESLGGDSYGIKIRGSEIKSVNGRVLATGFKYTVYNDKIEIKGEKKINPQVLLKDSFTDFPVNFIIRPTNKIEASELRFSNDLRLSMKVIGRCRDLFPDSVVGNVGFGLNFENKIERE